MSANCPFKELRGKLGYVPQKGVLFSGTIDSNIRYGREEATEAEVQRAAEIAQAWDFISEKEEKLDSPIAEGGTNVSGGQRPTYFHSQSYCKRARRFISSTTVFQRWTTRRMLFFEKH